jgi:hypothetical protein
LPDANELVKALKKAALEAVEASKPVKVFFGKVVSTNPLKINVEQKLVLGEAQLVLTQNVKELKATIDISCDTDSALSTHKHQYQNEDTTGVNLAHQHKIACKKEIIIRKGLANGDEVVLIRQQEGQKYIVLDRIG